MVALAAAMLVVAGCGDDQASPEPTQTPTPTPTTGQPTPSPAAAASPAAPDPEQHALTLEWNGRERQFRLDEPADRDPAELAPLVVVLHGGSGTGAAIRIQSGISSLARDHGVLVAYPYGVNGIWSPNPNSDRVDDVGFLTALVDHLVDEWGADPDRVYATGWSSGAEMSYRLAAEASEVFAAVAPVSGNFVAVPDSLEPAAPVSVLAVVGLSDTAVAGAGSIDTWRDLLDCQAGPPAALDGAEHVTRTEATCPDGSDVVEYRLAGVGHAWPELDSDGFDTNRIIWEFFAEHARSG